MKKTQSFQLSENALKAITAGTFLFIVFLINILSWVL